MTWLTATPRRVRALVPLGVVALAVGTMLVAIGHPDRIFFDEVYYVNDARDFLEFGVEDGFVVHPPLGKLLIATGIHLFGDTPTGWRIIGGLLAVASVWLVYLIARRLGLRLAAAGLAGVALALDGVFIASARTSMLDIHLAFFVVLGTYALVRDRDRVRRADHAALAEHDRRRAPPGSAPPTEEVGPDDDSPARTPATAGSPAAEQVTASRQPVVDAAPTRQVTASAVPPRDGTATTRPGLGRDESGLVVDWSGDDADSTPDDRDRAGDHPPPADHPDPGPDLPRVGRWWLGLAGLSFGAAVAVKWSGALALAAAGLVWLGIELARRRPMAGRWTRGLPRALAVGLVALVVVPVLAYAVSWTPWFVAFDNSYQANNHCGDDLDCSGVTGRAAALVDHHRRMVNFHLTLETEHAYRADAWNWPAQRRPVVFYYETCSQDRLNRVETTDSDGEVSRPEPCRVQPGQAAEIFDLGNPATWWLLLAGLPVVGLLLRRRDRHTLLVATFYLAQFLPWLLASRPVFNFYTVPLVPFVVLALALVVDRITSRDTWVSAMVAGTVLAAVALGIGYGLDALGVPTTDVGRWYAVAGAALVGGALAPSVPGLVTGPGPDRPRRRWPTLAVLGCVLAVGLFFLPTWTGVTMPEWAVKAHWWLPTWI